MISTLWTRRLQYLFLAIIVTTVGFSLYQWNASRASTQKAAPKNGLVGYWSFDEGTGTQAGDASGNGNTGTLTNGPTWTTGKLGKAINFDGVNDYVDAGNSSSVMPNFPFTISAWMKVPSGGTALITTGDPTNFSNGEYSGYTFFINEGQAVIQIGSNAGYCSGSYRNTYATTATTFTANQWYHVTAVLTNASSFSIYVNGSSVALTNSGTNGLAIGYAAAARLRMGGQYFTACSGTTYYFTGSVDEVRIYNRALSGTEITNLYNLGAEKLNVSPTASLTSGLVGYWTFDGKDTPWTSSSAGTATDRSGNGNTGTLTNMNQSTSIAEGKLGQALNFDGTNDSVAVSSDVIGSGATSICAWVNPRSMGGGGFGRIAVSGIGGGTEKTVLVMQSGPRIGLSSDGGTTNLITVNTISYNTWVHTCATRDASGNGIIYINGVRENSGTTGTPSGGTVSYIGNRAFADRTFDGLIDDVRIYNRQISATEIQSLYDLGASDNVNSSVSQNQGTGRLDSGLVGYWKLDDASGTTATDSSVNGNNGTLTNGPTWGTGKIGSAVDFNGTKYVTVPNSTPLQVTRDMTLSFWMYMRSYNGAGAWNPIISKFSTDISNEFIIRYQTSTTGQFYSGDGGALNTYLTWNPSADAGLNNWVHVVARRNITAGTMDMWFNGVKKQSTSASGTAAATTQPVQFGSPANGYVGSRDFDGLLDEVRIYNRAITDEEISQLYRLTTPTGVDTSLKGYWSFNGPDLSGTTAYDRSGKGNNGTLTNGPTRTAGRIGQAFSFDGVNDYVDGGVTVAPSVMSFSLWLNPSAYPSSTFYFEPLRKEGSYHASFNGTSASLQAGIKVSATSYDVNIPNANIPLNTWTLITLTADGSNVRAYVNGTLYGSPTSYSGSISDTAGNHTFIGTYGTTTRTNPGGGYRDFPGKIDEVRIYNRALTATEIQSLYNSGR